MDLTSLQCEVNHLLFLYYTSIGVLQRDYNDPTLDQSMDELLKEIVECKRRIDRYFSDGCHVENVSNDLKSVLEAGKIYREDALAFIDDVIGYLL